MSGRRLLTLLVVLAAVAVPAGVLQALCVGRSCDEPDAPAARVPFCPLPAPLREAIAGGYREERSPDVLGVAGDVPVFTEAGGTGLRAPWPSIGSPIDARVPIAFAGIGVTPGAPIADGVTLDRIAPTVSDILGLERPFPEVRSGTSIEGLANGDRPRLVLLIGWKGVGTSDLEASPDDWPFLASLVRDGAGTLQGETGSLPLDPTAALATIGTGGPPSEHGVTGSFVRNDEGEVVPAFGPGAPIPIVATLADDLDEATDQRADVSLVATDDLDRGLIGVGWAYERPDEDTVVIARDEAAVTAAQRILASGAGADDVPDVLAVVLDGGVRRIDRRTEEIVDAARAATEGSVLVVVAGTGSWERAMPAQPDSTIVSAVEDAVPGRASAVDATVPGGVFLDRGVLTEAAVTGQVAVDAILGVTTPDGDAMMADAFQGFAVSFARYC